MSSSLKQKLLNALICTLENVTAILLVNCFYIVLDAEVFTCLATGFA